MFVLAQWKSKEGKRMVKNNTDLPPNLPPSPPFPKSYFHPGNCSYYHLSIYRCRRSAEEPRTRASPLVKAASQPSRAKPHSPIPVHRPAVQRPGPGAHMKTLSPLSGTPPWLAGTERTTLCQPLFLEPSTQGRGHHPKFPERMC